MRSATYTRPRPPWIAALSWNSFTSICQHLRSASDYQRHGLWPSGETVEDDEEDIHLPGASLAAFSR